MTLNLKEVEHIAMLARLALSDEEKTLFAAQLSSILDYAARLQALDTAGIPPTFNVLTEEGRADSDYGLQTGLSHLRDDLPRTGLEDAELFENAPQVQDRQFRIPPVFE